jgi:hypothetical protein
MTHLSTNGNWRDLARQIEHENDPHKMIELAEQLLKRLDAEVLRQSTGPAANVE